MNDRRGPLISKGAQPRNKERKTVSSYPLCIRLCGSRGGGREQNDREVAGEELRGDAEGPDGLGGGARRDPRRRPRLHPHGLGQDGQQLLELRRPGREQ